MAEVILSEREAGAGRTALVVASEVNSRRLASTDAPPEFRALFGDAACAFALQRSAAGAGVPGRRLREFTWGTSGTYASALRVTWPEGGVPKVHFRGEQLAGAAITVLERVIDRLTALSGVSTSISLRCTSPIRVWPPCSLKRPGSRLRKRR
jgi:3-oxoacyl-[acyl-carrier-protein] synthase III